MPDGANIFNTSLAPKTGAMRVQTLANRWDEKVSGLRGNVTKDVLDEGIVYHLAEGVTVPLWMDRNETFKIINNKFILKHNI